MASREPNNLRLPATSSSKLSGALDADDRRQHLCPRGQRLEAFPLERRRPLEYPQRSCQRQGRVELGSRSDAGLGRRVARGDDVQLTSLCFDDYGGQRRISGGETLEREARQADGDPKLELAWRRPTIGARSFRRARSEQLERLENSRHALTGAEAWPEAAPSSAKPATSTTPGRPPRHLMISTRVAECACDCACDKWIRNAAGERCRRALAGRNSKTQHP